VILALSVCLTFGLWVAVSEHWVRRAEQAQIESHIGVAERKLHEIASQAFGSMMDAARLQSSSRYEWHR
jgi:hypothetical protein